MNTKLTKIIEINSPDKDIVFDGVDFTKHAFIHVTNAKSISLRNCRIYNLNGSSREKYFMKISGNFPIKLVVERCFFGNNDKIYNLFELNTTIADGTLICNNYFKKGNCTHNEFGFYGVVEDAKWVISNNYFEDCQAGIRLGMKGSPKCSIDIANNIVNKISKFDELNYEGLLTIQPYGKSTKTFENVFVNMYNNKLPVEQFAYMYISSKDTQLTPEQYPIVKVDGKSYKLATYN